MDPEQTSDPRRKKRIIIATIVIVVAVTLSTVSVVMINRDGRHGGTQNVGVLPPAEPNAIPGGFRFTMWTVLGVNASWGDIGFGLVDTQDRSVAWSNITTADLTSSDPPITWHFGSAQSLGTLSVWLNITDVKGNGVVDQDDFVDLTGSHFSHTMYNFVLVYEPTMSAGNVMWDPGWYT